MIGRTPIRTKTLRFGTRALFIDTTALRELCKEVMTLLHKAFQDKKFDVRLIEKNTSRGILSTSELEQNQSQLPDDAENADYISLDALTDDGDSDVCPSEQTHH